jgi:predicted DNA-binding mobile mystery protein A
MTIRPRFLRDRALHELDHALRLLRPTSDAPPTGGWLWPVREALGMTTRQLGRRVGVSKTSVTAAERAEREGTITLATLRRYAEGLDCQLVYSLVPDAGSNLPIRLELRRGALAKGKRARLWR